MRTRARLSPLLAAFLLALPAMAATHTATAAPRRSTDAEDILKKMSEYLGGLQAFRLHAAAIEEKVTKDGQRIQFPFSSEVAVQRPNALRVDRASPGKDVEFRYDGKHFVVFDPKSLLYAEEPAPGNIDEAIDTALERYNIDAPAADLLGSDPYATLMDGVTSSAYLGLEPMDGVQCHHLAFRSKNVDWQIWVEDGARPVPHRYVIVSKDIRDEPQFAVQLSRWETDVKLPEDLFAFEPPNNATRIPLMQRQTRQGRK